MADYTALVAARSGSDIVQQLGSITLETLIQMDDNDELKGQTQAFRAPTIHELKRDNSSDVSRQTEGESERRCIYFCGNSLGLQPLRTRAYVLAHLQHWQSKGVYGHFSEGSAYEGARDSRSPPIMDVDEEAKGPAARVVGAKPDEVAVMQTLTANLHFLMASFYRPTKQRYKIILEGKAFPSDHYAVESHIQTRDINPKEAMVLIEPPSTNSLILPTSHILSVIDQHASSAALLLLPGIQYYTGQLFEIQKITAYAQSRGIVVGWDLAHAVGNVPLKLHDWNVDFAAWCNYKYMNCGPGAIGGLFVHERHTQVTPTSAVPNGQIESGTQVTPNYRPRLAGWWGSAKDGRFSGVNHFVPSPGAGGFQLSNPSALDLAAVRASMSIFAAVSMTQLRAKSLKLTAILEHLLMSPSLLNLPAQVKGHWPPYSIITPADPRERGAQLSIKLDEGLLEPVMERLGDAGVVVDERKPDVVRVAPAPLYNTYVEVWRFCEIFTNACYVARSGKI
ncbi:MAG: Kynureninase (L-kynurenine hydrolase) [Chrysothrix sp. TS-e1954]|nr:MAG: Kynureninase (L-kynurenine hydrolase) [Chrysothrix sp. TS-e1954]